MSNDKNNDKLKHDKMKALELTLGNIEKNYGKGTIMKLGDEAIEDVEVISTGSISLDFALGVGGLPKGRVIEIYGPESSGKTTLALHAIAEAQKKGGIAAFIAVLAPACPACLSFATLLLPAVVGISFVQQLVQYNTELLIVSALLMLLALYLLKGFEK